MRTDYIWMEDAAEMRNPNAIRCSLSVEIKRQKQIMTVAFISAAAVVCRGFKDGDCFSVAQLRTWWHHWELFVDETKASGETVPHAVVNMSPDPQVWPGMEARLPACPLCSLSVWPASKVVHVIQTNRLLVWSSTTLGCTLLSYPEEMKKIDLRWNKT